MCNKIKCAGQYTVHLINNNISRNVQEECANMMMTNLNQEGKERGITTMYSVLTKGEIQSFQDLKDYLNCWFNPNPNLDLEIRTYLDMFN